VIRLFHSVALLSLTIIGLNSCAGPKKALSKSAPPAAAGVDQKVALPEGAPPAEGNTPPLGPNASRDDYWNLAMQRYKPPASGSQTALAELPEPSTGTAVTPAPTVSTTPSASKPAVSATPAQDLNPADIPYATWAPGKRGVVKSPFDPGGRLIDVRDFNAGQTSQCPYTGKVFRVPPLK
jgi:hypothetical protein